MFIHIERNLIFKLTRKRFKYIDFNKWQKGIVRQSDIESEYIIYEHFIQIIIDTIITTYLGNSKRISKKENYLFDGVHLNKLGAKGLAELITTEQLN